MGSVCARGTGEDGIPYEPDAQADDRSEVGLVSDAFGDDLGADARPEAHEDIDDGLTVGVLCDAANEVAIDLQHIRLNVEKHLEVRMTHSDVVERNR